MSDNQNVRPGSWLGDGVEEFKKLPPWGKAGVGVVILGVAYLGYRSYKAQKSGTVSGAISAGQVASGQDIASPGGGLQSPFGSIPSGPNAGAVPLLPTGVSPIFDPAGNLIGWSQPGAPGAGTVQPGVGTPPPIPSGGGSVPTIIDRIRARFSQAGASTYDKNTPGGVPERATPGGKQVGLLAYGSAVDITGNPIVGPSNFGGTSGSDIWYKLSNGNYVSQYDITPTIQQVPGATQPPKMPKVQA